MGDSVLEHTGQISLTDTLLETEHPQNRPTTTVEQLAEMERPVPSGMLKLLADSTVADRSSLLSSTGSR